MPERPTQHQIDLACESWSLGADRLRSAFLPALKSLATLRDRVADGYPPASFPEHRGSAELTPTEAAASAREKATDLERRALRAYESIEGAFVAMANVLSVIRSEEPTAERAAAEQTNEARGFCVNCARHGQQSVRWKSSRCCACYEYRRTHDGADRPEALVLAHLRRRVLTYDRAHRGVERFVNGRA